MRLVGLICPSFPTTHPGGHNPGEKPTPRKVPLQPRWQNWGKGEREENWLSRCSSSPHLNCCTGISYWQRTKQKCLFHYPPPPPPGEEKILINPPAFSFPKSFSPKDTCLDTDKLTNLMPYYPFWAVPDSASDFVSDNISQLFKAALNISLGPYSQWPRYKVTSDFFCKEKKHKILLSWNTVLRTNLTPT